MARVRQQLYKIGASTIASTIFGGFLIIVIV